MMMVDCGLLIVDCGDGRTSRAASPCAFSTINNPQSTLRSAFTLIEILVVIVIIVLLLALAIPAFNVMRGSRSIDGAENQIAAMIARARSDAIGLQKPFGVMFFMTDFDSDGRVGVAEVSAAEYPDGGTPQRDVYLDIVEDTDFLYLPPGVLAFTVNNGLVNQATRQRQS